MDLRGGAENGEFPYIGEVREDAVLYQYGQLSDGELVLEVEGLPVSGLPLYDVLTIINTCKSPIRIKTVRQGKVSKSHLCEHCSSVNTFSPQLYNHPSHYLIASLDMDTM